MKKPITPLYPVLFSVLSACSSSSGDGIEPDPSSGSSSSTGGDGKQPSANQNRASLYAWQRFQGAFDSVGQQPLNEGGYMPPTPRQLVGCNLNAPELGERVVYVERRQVDDDQTPDRQMIIVFTAVEAGLHESAIGAIHQPTDPSAWVGQCSAGTELPLLSAVEDVGECELQIVLNELGVLAISASTMPARCVSASLDATSISTGLVGGVNSIIWGDVLSDEDGSSRSDPPSAGDPQEEILNYELARRTPLPALPEGGE